MNKTKQPIFLAWLSRSNYLLLIVLLFHSPLLAAEILGNSDNLALVDRAQFSNFDIDIKAVEVLPPDIRPTATRNLSNIGGELDLFEAVRIALNRHPTVSAAAAALAQQNSAVDLAKSAYWPQFQAGVSSGKYQWGIGNQQQLMLFANQTLYDFGKIKNNVKTSKAVANQQKAYILDTIDEVSLETAEAVINISRYQSLIKLVQSHISKINHILDITKLRAKAGLTSEADPIQAISRYENAQSLLLDTQMLLRHWEARLNTLTGLPPPYNLAPLPEKLFAQAKLYKNPAPNQLPVVISAEYERQAALAQKDLAHANRMPTLSLEGAINQGINGVTFYNNLEGGTYRTVMLKISSAPWQGSSRALVEQAASYAIEAARAKRDSAYLQVSDKIKDYREQIMGTKKRLKVLAEREQSIIRTRELYEEQYKVGHRTALDLLNAEQEIQFAASERENARYNMWLYIVKYISVTGRARKVYSLNNTTIQGIEIK
ncbi:outer membrane channel protein [Legionella massiliensis]|uniref:Outer membrane channel protein n=1 Tax=Legionella massiliensis TaxID=1034943 RepID=A0A078KNT9_9GAMM|nr:TolC family protein [Legionella massiliensis]CDZ76025.1 outer membrane channel protein [Legionella massiliensis]CEE11763.1 Outer membrane protein TolC precursor [Legionella massiliensis]